MQLGHRLVPIVLELGCFHDVTGDPSVGVGTELELETLVLVKLLSLDDDEPGELGDSSDEIGKDCPLFLCDWCARDVASDDTGNMVDEDGLSVFPDSPNKLIGLSSCWRVFSCNAPCDSEHVR